jgi:outer membrane protein assembly factor BamA
MIPALALAAVLLQNPAPGAAPVQEKIVPEKIAEIRVHGNATISDAAVIALAGVTVGASLDEGGLDAIQKKLRDSGRFDDVQVRKRYRTLAMDEVALLLIVHEKPGVSPTGQPPSAMKRMANRLMFFPIVDYDDGYGWTYGGRTTVVDLLGKGTHVSVPLSWGGTRRAAVEANHTFLSGPFTRLSGSFGVTQRENPHYEIDDRRTTLSGRAERRLFGRLTLGGEAATSKVTFEPSHDQFWSGGADVTLDTRDDPGFPSDALLAGAAWNRLNAMGDTRALWSSPGIDRYKLEGRGYKRLFRQTVAAGRVRYDSASAPLPLYEQFLLGGSLLRGLDAGAFTGDSRLLWGVEIRAPFTSPLGGGRLGLNAFLDGGAVAPYGATITDQHMYRGAGGGFFVDSKIIQLHFDVAHSLDGKGTHFHFGTSFTF